MKGIIISVLVASTFIGVAIVLTKDSGGQNAEISDAGNVSIVEGKQIIEIRARGGYEPRKSVAKAGVPTILRFNTSGTFDCSSSIRIPSLGVSKILPQTGSTDIEIGNPKVSTLKGSCGMGMYPFEVDFRI